MFYRSSYSHTVNLPRTSFPQRVEGEKRIELDRKIVTSDSFQSVYRRQFDQRSNDKVTQYTSMPNLVIYVKIWLYMYNVHYDSLFYYPLANQS